MAACGQADLLDVVGDREEGVDPWLHLRLDGCAVQLRQPFLQGKAETVRCGRHVPLPSLPPLPPPCLPGRPSAFAGPL